MRVLVAGASGVIGRPLVERLVAAGHDVVGLTRSHEDVVVIESRGGTGVVADVLDRASLAEVLRRHRPEAVVDQVTALPASYNAEAMRGALQATNRVRVEGGGNLQAAAVAAGATRYVVQSGCYYYEPGAGLAGEEVPFVADAPPLVAGGVEALTQLERRVLDEASLTGVVLRYGFFYGPGTWYAVDGDVARQVRAGHFPVTSDGAGVWPFVHVNDAADATVAAVVSGDGIYNIADGDAAALSEWLPAYAGWLDAPPPPTAPAEGADADQLFYATRLRGADSSRAHRELGFDPRRRPWFDGTAVVPHIRREQRTDQAAVRRVLWDAFHRHDEADLVEQLRRSPEHLPELTFVAEIDGTIVGHIAFSGVVLEPGGERGVALAPMSVLPELQRRGVGAALVRHGLEAARAAGKGFVIVVGHAEYYPRFGFEPAARFGLRAPWPVPSESWMVHRLGRSQIPSGTVRYSAAFDTP